MSTGDKVESTWPGQSIPAGMKGRNHIMFMLYDPLSDSSELNITFSHEPTHG
jgi:hypothetical protein